jgi:hypothetical protein
MSVFQIPELAKFVISILMFTPASVHLIIPVQADFSSQSMCNLNLALMHLETSTGVFVYQQ